MRVPSLNLWYLSPHSQTFPAPSSPPYPSRCAPPSASVTVLRLVWVILHQWSTCAPHVAQQPGYWETQQKFVPVKIRKLVQLLYEISQTLLESPWWPSGSVLALRAEDTGIEHCFTRSSHSCYLIIGPLVATQKSPWCFRLSARTGWPCVSALWLGEIVSLISKYVSVAVHCYSCLDRSITETAVNTVTVLPECHGCWTALYSLDLLLLLLLF